MMPAFVPQTTIVMIGQKQPIIFLGTVKQALKELQASGMTDFRIVQFLQLLLTRSALLPITIAMWIAGA